MLLECRNITYQYADSDTNVFKELSCRIEGAGFHALFGTSGIGKTTIARMIAGEMTDYTGDIITRGLKSILYTYNFEKLPGWYSVGDHLHEVTPPARQPLISELMPSFGLEHCLTSRFSQLSLGQQNRINLLRYLLQDFDLLIMDESLANVDESTREIIILKIKELFPDKCFLYISHNVIDVAKFCNVILTLRSPFKWPQTVLMNGLNYNGRKTVEKKELEAIMLEIVNAS
jgi:ABC-type multidrug transport system ATPase subunit